MNDSTLEHTGDSDFSGLREGQRRGNAALRQEVTSRLAAHRARRRRRLDPDGMLSFDFEVPAEAPAFGYPERDRSEPNTVFSADPDMPLFEAHPFRFSGDVPVPARSRSEASSTPDTLDRRSEEEMAAPFSEFQESLQQPRILEFPAPQHFRVVRRKATPIRRDELAEPVDDQLRIFEVAEDPLPRFTVPYIQLETDHLPQDPEVALELPLRVASILQRTNSVFWDLLIVAGGTAIFATAALLFIKSFPVTRSALLGYAVAPIMLWGFYQALFLVGCGYTIGMRIACLEMLTFEGMGMPEKQRKWRAAAVLMSLASCGLGFAWAALDEDRLGWHDRISRTYLASQRDLRH